MTAEQQALLMIRGAIASADKQAQLAIDETAERIREAVRAAPEAGIIALALVGAEVSANEFK